MSHSSDDKHNDSEHLPKPIVKKTRSPFPWIWIVPILAAMGAGYYYYLHLQESGPEITLRFSDATGLKAGESKMIHRGVPIGLVNNVELSSDQKQALVRVRLVRSESSFAKNGATFWIVRPEISMQQISGLATVISGPVIDGTPGAGDIQTEFTGLDKSPAPVEDGINIILRTENLSHLQSESPVYFRGIQVGDVQSVALSADATGVDIHAVIERRYAPLVKTNSQFWVLSAVDLKGGLFTGVQMKVESLRSLLSGGVAFATPEEDMGDQAGNGSSFVLHDDSKKEWLTWAPKIAIEPDTSGQGEDHRSASREIRSAVETK